MTTLASHQAFTCQQEELRTLKAQLRRVAEERDILREAAACFESELRKDTHS